MSNPSIEENMYHAKKTAYEQLKEWIQREPTDDEIQDAFEAYLDHWEGK